MNYNLKVTLEKINGKFLAETEVAGVGRVTRRHTVDESFEDAMKSITAVHKEGVESIAGYHSGGVTQPSAPKVEQPEPKATAVRRREKDADLAPKKKDSKQDGIVKKIKRKFAAA